MTLSHSSATAALDAHGVRIALVVSEYHASITHAMRDAAIEVFAAAGGNAADLHVLSAAGSFELVGVCRAAVWHLQPDAAVAIGCIIAGETMHDRHLADGVVYGLTQITVQSGVPIALGVLTCQSMAQARARAGGQAGNKGVEAMSAAIRTAQTIRSLQLVPAERP